MKTLAIVLIILGIVMIFINQVGFTRQEEVLDLGSVEVNKNEREVVSWPLYAGIFVAAAGVVVLLVGNRNKTA